MTISLFQHQFNSLRHTFIAAALVTGVAFPFAGTAHAFEANVIKDTAYGQVSGALVNDGAAYVWKGVPYAKAPVGELRWKAPEDPEKWSDVRDATADTPLCPQNARGEMKGQEDCLTMDIYRPNSTEDNLPVLYFIHGGNNQGGTSAEINAEQLAVDANIVVVSVNYRLGLLGFNNLPALKTGDANEDSGNYSLLDMSKSLEWIKENIGNFGGDGENITVSGFSAGGRDVMAILISPLFKGQFQKAISFSGGMTLADAGESTKLIAKAVAPLVVEDGIKPDEASAYDWLMSTDGEVRTYLEGLDALRLANLMNNAGIRMAVFPHLYNDGTVLPENGYNTEAYNSVPLIMVTGTSEFSLFARYDGEFVKTSDDELMAGGDRYDALAFASGYGSKLYELFNAQDSAQKMLANYDAPIYTTRFAWGTNPDVAGEKLAKLFGSFHGVWVPFLTERTTGFSGVFADSFNGPGVQDLSGTFQSYVGNFMRTGNPNGEGLVEWKPWEAADTGPTQLILDADNEKAIVEMSEERTAYDDVLKQMDADTSIPPEVKDHLIKNVLNGRWFSHGLDQHYGNTNPWVGVQ